MIRTTHIVTALLLATGAALAPVMLAAPAQAAHEAGANAIAEKYASLLERDYVYPDTGKRYAAAIRAAMASGRYAPLSGDALAKALDATVNGVSPDGHLRVRPPEGGTPVAPPAGSGPPRAAPVSLPPVEQPGWIAPGIAYIRFNLFPMDAAVTAQAAKFMADHADAKAIIFDIRTHRGGGLDQMDVIFPWLFDKPTRLVTMATRASVDAAGGSPIAGVPTLRQVSGDPGMVAREHWATPNGDKRLHDAKIFVLTSGASGSAAEHFALAMKHTGRGTLVGPIIGAVTLILLLAGYGVGHVTALGRAARYLETIFLSLTAFLLAVPAVSETLRRVPDGNPIVTDLQSPILLGAQAAIAVVLVVGLTIQMIRLRREGHRSA